MVFNTDPSPQAPPTCTTLMDASKDDQCETSVIADLAKTLGHKLCKKAKLQMCLFSLNIDVATALMLEQDFKAKMVFETFLFKAVNEL